MMDAARLAEICRDAEQICKKYDLSLTCDVFDAVESKKYASLHATTAPSEGQVGVIITADIQRVSQIDVPKLVAELEQVEEIWRVFLTFRPAHGLS